MPHNAVKLKTVFPECNRVLQLQENEDDWKSIYKRSGLEKRAIENLKRKALLISEHVDDEDLCSTGMLRKKHDYPGVYILDVAGHEMNVRIFCCTCKINNELRLVLLHSFQEKDNATAGTKSYNKAWPIAKTRKAALIETVGI